MRRMCKGDGVCHAYIYPLSIVEHAHPKRKRLSHIYKWRSYSVVNRYTFCILLLWLTWIGEKRSYYNELAPLFSPTSLSTMHSKDIHTTHISCECVRCLFFSFERDRTHGFDQAIEQSHILYHWPKLKKRYWNHWNEQKIMIEYEIIDDHSMNIHLPFTHSVLQTT